MKLQITILLVMAAVARTDTVYLSDSAYSITSPSSTTPIYHVIKLSYSQIKDLNRDEKQALVQGLINKAANKFIHLVSTDKTTDDM